MHQPDDGEQAAYVERDAVGSKPQYAEIERLANASARPSVCWWRRPRQARSSRSGVRSGMGTRYRSRSRSENGGSGPLPGITFSDDGQIKDFVPPRAPNARAGGAAFSDVRLGTGGRRSIRRLDPRLSRRPMSAGGVAQRLHASPDLQALRCGRPIHRRARTRATDAGQTR